MSTTVDPGPEAFDPAHGLFDLLGGEFEEFSEDRVVAVMDPDRRHHQPYGLVHGGVYCVIVESVASVGASIWALGRGHAGAVGVSNSTDFLRSHREGPMRSVGTPLHRGRTQQLWEVVITRESDGKELARGKVRLQNLLDPAVIGGTSRPEKS